MGPFAPPSFFFRVPSLGRETKKLSFPRAIPFTNHRKSLIQSAPFNTSRCDDGREQEQSPSSSATYLFVEGHCMTNSRGMQLGIISRKTSAYFAFDALPNLAFFWPQHLLSLLSLFLYLQKIAGVEARYLQPQKAHSMLNVSIRRYDYYILE